MLPVNSGGHSAYQNFVLENLRKYYPNPNLLPQSTWDIIDRFWNLDLSYTDELLRSKYSIFGPKPRTPSCMQRSYLLSLDFKITSITDWVAQLRMNPLYAILSGFDVDDTPGIGTFYDFFKRLWDFDSDNLSSHIQPLKETRIKKPDGRNSKAEPIEKVSVADLFKRLEPEAFSVDKQPYASLFHIFKNEFLDKSVQLGLINSNQLTLAGDGTPIVTSARLRKHKVCDCIANGIYDCKCDRYFSQPDCDMGWDSSRNCFYHGYHLYMLVAANSESDLPLFPLLHPASKHDSHAFPEAYFRFRKFLPEYHPSKWLLDSAHDAMPYYIYCRRNHITPFIDLNAKRGIKEKYKGDFTIGKDGIPVCTAGKKMRRDGCEKAKGRLKYRCPLMNRKKGCSCDNPCSASKYGRTVHLSMKDNPRLFNIPPRESDEWKKEYNARTSAERSNKREKVDFKLEGGRHRSTKMWYCRLYHILMLQHLDAWDLPYESATRKLILQTA